MSVSSLATKIKAAVEYRIKMEAQAMRGTIQNGRFSSGGKSYPYTTAVDCDTSEGKKVWAQKAQDGRAVIIGD